MTARTVFVTGATGQQGKALIQALRPDDNSTLAFHVLALTRTATSPSAEDLGSEKHVTVVEGDLDSPESIRKIFEAAKDKGGIWGVFCVLAYPGLGANADGEEKQGKILADIALEFGVSSYIFSSVERGGEYYDDKLVLDRLAKVNIERHIRELGTKGLPWTILRPGFFMENYDGFIGSVTVAAMKAGLKPTTTMQLIAADDIGNVAAAVFKSPETYASQILAVVGDILTMSEQEAAYEKATGRLMPSIPSFLARGLIAMNGQTQEILADVERIHLARTSGEAPEVEGQRAAARAAYPEIKSLEAWAATRAKGPASRPDNWNQFSIIRLIMGKK